MRGDASGAERDRAGTRTPAGSTPTPWPAPTPSSTSRARTSATDGGSTEARKREVLSRARDHRPAVADARASLDGRRRRCCCRRRGSARTATAGTTCSTRTSRSATTFFADVVRQWEAATAPAQDAGVRVVHLRTGIVLARGGGALGRLLPLLRRGVGGPLGSGRQFWAGSR